jgi:hypothetical protein
MQASTILRGLAVAFVLLLAGVGWWGYQTLATPPSQASIRPEVVADYLHAVIEASRTVYATTIVDKMQRQGVVKAAEQWRDEHALPLPAQFLIETGRHVAEKGSGVKYRLASLTPIYVWNLPNNDFEKKGLDAVIKDPDKPFTGFTQVGQKRFFQAVYPDFAVAESCVACHNQHPNSPKRDYKLNDVMGGVIITIPITD